MSGTGSTLACRALGRELRRLRARARLQQAEAARLSETSPQSIGRMEDGQYTRITSFQVNALCNAYGATDAERELVLALLEEAKAVHKGRAGSAWWRGFADEIPSDFNHYISLEDSANRLTILATDLVPGLVQIPEYRRVLAWAENPTWTPEEVDRRMQVATNRQQRLQDPDFRLDVFLTSAVLENWVGSDAVMREQLLRLVEISKLPNVSIRVVPRRALDPIGPLVSSFSLLEFPALPSSKLQEPPVVYVEGYVGDLYVEGTDEIAQYRSAVDRIGRVALDLVRSREAILKAAEEYKE
ncbi:DUF5753 domain-containing protein [Nocardia terpenica]|uniref:XRE family transcriptional regulator n=1 Tax=Nocardia terpenica TaxID=455432 RepID=A0A291RN67_9NOCA|nr:DUF5753 domain-containing protein [Nocardia terpenica]ATL69051.1 XRE family transcriptional regulator [Nocardia terpenica]